MPVKSEIESNAESVPRGRRYVFDFLYHDAQRIGSFQAQLGSYGQRKTIKHRSGSAEESVSETTVRAKGSVPTLASADAGLNKKETTRHNVDLDEEYDPFWLEGLDLYSTLDDLGLINRDISLAGLGSFVLVTGEILIVDTANARPAMTSPDIKPHLVQSMTDQIAQNGSPIQMGSEASFSSLVGAERGKRAKRDAKLSFDVMMSLPNIVQMRVRMGDGKLVYCAIKKDALTIPPVDIILNHGSVLQGEWHVLGLYDARPDPMVLDMQETAKRFGINDSQVLSSATAYGPSLRVGFEINS